MRSQNPLRPGWSSLGGLNAASVESQFLRATLHPQLLQQSWSTGSRFRGLGDSDSPICRAVVFSATQGVTFQADGSIVLTDPNVVVAASQPGFTRMQTNPTFPGYGVVPRAEAQRRNVPIVWDPWSQHATGARIAGGLRLARDITPWTAPDGCREATGLPVPVLPGIGPAIATGLSVGISRIVLGAVVLAGLGIAAYFVFRD
jgi:hypothetical protein